jgi:hypothetical protein
MSRFVPLLLIALVAPVARADDPPPSVRPPPAPPSAQLSGSADIQPGGDVDTAVFNARLSPYGRWVETPEYGRVWVPGNVNASWRPYTYGHWVYTDWGWTWVSDEPWGWATYHYGRWWWGAGVGWYWVPGRRWGPAWVSWRWSAGYVAWVPLVPRRAVLWGVGSPYWVTVQSAHFTRPINTVVISPAQARPIVAATRPIGGAYARPVGGFNGPPVAHISTATGTQITARPVGQVFAGARAHASSGYARTTPSARASTPPGSRGPGRGGGPGRMPAFRGGGRRKR